MISAGDVALKVIQQPSQHKPRRAGQVGPSPWHQYWPEDLQSTAVFFYVIALCSRRSNELWICDMSSPSPDEVLVVNILVIV